MPWEIIKFAGIGFVIGFIFGFLLKKAFKIAFIILLGFILFQVFAKIEISVPSMPSLNEIHSAADNFLNKNNINMSTLNSLIKTNNYLLYGFIGGIITGLIKN